MSKSNTNYKEFGLSTASVNNRKTVFLSIAIIIIAGLGFYTSMPRESFPEIQIPEIYVGVAYPGSSPEFIEDKITRPLEKEINTIKDIDEITSTTIHGYSSIRVKFDFKVTPTEGLRKVKDAVDKARGDKDFPQDLPADPNIFEMDFAQMPVLNINLSGDYPVEALKKYAEDLADKIENVSEVSEVSVRGVQEKEVSVRIRKHDAEAKSVTFGDIENAIRSENMTMSGGEISSDNTERSLRVEGEFEDWKEIKNLIVKDEDFNLVYLHEVADVYFTDADITSYARQFNQPVVMLDVKKRSGENLIEAVEKIKAVVADAKKNDIPSNIQLTLTNDQSVQIKDQVSNLENSIIFGVLLVVLVLLFFLGLRNALFVGVAIPLSMFMSFMLLGAAGVTLNVMVLFSLVLALGMLVDNGIVVVENIYRLMDEEGMNAFEASKKGVGEVAWPIIASTATTLAAFIPLAMWPGIMGEFMQYLPITLIIVLGSSLFVALVINPVLTALYMKVKEETPNKKRLIKTSIFLILIGTLLILFKAYSNISFGIGPLKSDNFYVIGNLLIAFGLLAVVNLYFLSPATAKFQSKFLPVLELKYLNFLEFAFSEQKNKRKYGLINLSRLIFVKGIGRVLPNKISSFIEKIFISFYKRYVQLFFGTLGLLFLSIALIIVVPPKVLFFPENQPNYVNVFIEHPIGTSINVTNETTQDAKRIIDSTLAKYGNVYDVAKITNEQGEETTDTIFFVKSVIEQVGEGTSDPMQGPTFGTTPHKARISINFAEFQYRKGFSTGEALKEIEAAIKNKFNADVKIVAEKNQDGPPQSPPVNIEFSGSDDYLLLVEKAEILREYLESKNVVGVKKLALDIELGKPELPLEIDRNRARAYGLSTSQVAMQIRTALFGKDVSTYKEGDDSYEINIRYSDAFRNNIDALLDQKITFRNNKGKLISVPIRSVIKEPKKTSTYSAVKRKDLDNVVTIQSGILEGYNPNEVVAELKKYTEEFAQSDDGKKLTKEGFLFAFTGQQEEQAKEMKFLSTALLIAVFLILLIIVAQFNSFSTPLIILSSVILSLIGVFLGLVISRQDFVIIMTMIGIISLAGVVVNNAIVLIDYTNLILARKREELNLTEFDVLPNEHIIDAIIKAGKTRLRPVLLTAITTVLGLIPLAVGININFITLFSEFDPQFYIGGDNVMFFGPMSWTIIYGLTFATFLTLVVVPILYLLLYRLKLKLLKMFGMKYRSNI
jgi:multidrug efflux pump